LHDVALTVEDDPLRRIPDAMTVAEFLGSKETVLLRLAVVDEADFKSEPKEEEFNVV